MWKSETSPRTEDFELSSSPRGAVATGMLERELSELERVDLEPLDLESPELEPPDPRAFLRMHPGAQRVLEDLRRGPAGVVAAVAGELQAGEATIGSRFTEEMAVVSRRERQVREMQALATHRVVDLTTEQLRRILEFMA